MSVRTKSRALQWTLWLCAALAGLAVYVVLSRLLYGSMSWNVVLPQNQRIVLPILALFWLFAWETRWDGIRRDEGTGKREQGSEGGAENRCRFRAEEDSGSAVQLVDAAACRVGKDCADSDLTRQAAASTEKTNLHSAPTPNTYTSAASPSDDATGEALFAQARALPHLEIPDFVHDADYLDLLGQSARKDYSPALAKLGEYAMRRCAWVEAYYWMKLAQRNGMHGLSPMLREIRKNWSRDGFPDQASNVNKLFTLEAGSLGRALLHVDSGHEAAKAREFLRANHPEFLS